MSKKLMIVLILVLALTGALAAVFVVYDFRQRGFDSEIAAIQGQMSEMRQQLQSLEAQQKLLAALPPKEIERREIIREKSQDELLTAAVARLAPTVVSIVVSKDVPQLEIVYQNPFGDDPFFKNFDIKVPVFRQKGVERQKVGAGTGFLIKSDGTIITNRHVVNDEAAEYTILLSDGSQKPARVVYKDPNYDIALVKIEGSYPVATLGNSSTLKLGQTVAAIGNALGEYSNSVSVGIISGLNRTIEASGGGTSVKLTGVIQTDAAINPGNSGGPLLDLTGKVVGVNVATVIGSNSISFSIPINVAQEILRAVKI